MARTATLCDMDNPPTSASRAKGSRRVTDLAVRNLQPRAARYIEWFAEGFGVRVSPAGGKSFLYWYSFGKKKRMLLLGSYPATSVKEALAKHKEASLLRARGTDPATKKADAKLAAAARPTLRDAFGLWLSSLTPYTDSEGTRHGRKDGGAVLLLQFRKHVFPTLGDVALADVSRGEVVELLDRVKAAGKRRTAAVLFSTFRQFLDWASDRQRVPHNVLSTLRKKKIVGIGVKRTRALADWELVRLLERIGQVDLHAVTVLALRFVLATGQRPGEVAALPKCELDATGALWTIPAARYKTGQVQRVPLSAHARRLLADAAAYNGQSDYVFPSPQSITRTPDDADRCVDRHSLSRAILRKLGTPTAEGIAPAAGTFGLEPFTPHDLRRTCRTHLAKLRVPSEIAERVLGHKIGGMVDVYDQHDYLDECREALALWGAKLDKLAGNIQ